MLAMPVATTIELVALSISPAFVKASRPHASGSHMAAYPSDSSSLATSPLRSALTDSCAKVQMPTVPRSFSSAGGHVDMASSLGSATRDAVEPANWSDGLLRYAGERVPRPLGGDRTATGP